MEMLFFMILKNQEFDIRSSLQIIFSDHADTDTVTTRSDVAGNAERKRIIVDIHFRVGRRKHICQFFFLLCTKTGTCSTETQTFKKDTLETENKMLSIQPQPVSEKLRDIAESFGDMAENREMNYCLDIAPELTWNTDLSCFNKIAGNLISNAFMYTPDKGNISETLYTKNERLI